MYLKHLLSKQNLKYYYYVYHLYMRLSFGFDIARAPVLYGKCFVQFCGFVLLFTANINHLSGPLDFSAVTILSTCHLRQTKTKIPTDWSGWI